MYFSWITFPILLGVVINTVTAYDRCTYRYYCDDGYYCCRSNTQCCKDSLADGAVAGIVIGCFIVLIVVILVIVFCIKKKQHKTRVTHLPPQNTGNVTLVSTTMNPGYGPSYGQGYGPSYGQYSAPNQPSAPYPPQKAGFDQGPPAYPPPVAY